MTEKTTVEALSKSMGIPVADLFIFKEVFWRRGKCFANLIFTTRAKFPVIADRAIKQGHGVLLYGKGKVPTYYERDGKLKRAFPGYGTPRRTVKVLDRFPWEKAP